MSSATDPLLCAYARLLADRPDRVLLCCGESASRVSDLNALSAVAEACVRARSLPVDRPVGLSAPGGPGFLASFLALRRLGLVVVLLDHGTTVGERRAIYRRMNLSATLVCRDAWPQGPGDWSLELHDREAGADSGPSIRGLAVIKLSSGSSGRPRGIGVSSQALLADDRNLRTTMGIRAEDRLLATVPLSHSYGFSSLALAALVNGNRLVLPDGPRPLAPLEAAALAEATVFPTVPAYLRSLTRLASPPALPPSLRLVVSAGAPLEARVARRFREMTGRQVHVFYGASECGGITYDRKGGAAERGSVGEPVEGVRVRLVPHPATGADEEGGPLEVREISPGGGLVEVRSDAVAQTYVPEPDPSLEGGVFRSKDLGHWRGSELALEGRLDDLINFRGRKFHPSEVERTLLGLSGVEEAVVFAAPGTGRNGDIVPVAVVAGPEGSVCAEEAVAWCRERLSPFKVPRIVRIVRELPRNDRGKVDPRRLRELLE